MPYESATIYCGRQQTPAPVPAGEVCKLTRITDVYGRISYVISKGSSELQSTTTFDEAITQMEKARQNELCR
jgi:hypothetical protein